MDSWPFRHTPSQNATQNASISTIFGQGISTTFHCYAGLKCSSVTRRTYIPVSLFSIMALLDHTAEAWSKLQSSFSQLKPSIWCSTWLTSMFWKRRHDRFLWSHYGLRVCLDMFGVSISWKLSIMRMRLAFAGHIYCWQFCYLRYPQIVQRNFIGISGAVSSQEKKQQDKHATCVGVPKILQHTHKLVRCPFDNICDS